MVNAAVSATNVALVADSVPASEFQECINKASALLKAVAIAEQGMG